MYFNSSSPCLFSITWSHQLHSTEMIPSSLDGISLCWPHAKGQWVLQTLVKQWKKQVLPTVNHHIFISGKENKFKWCYKAYLFMQTLFLSFSRQDVGTTLEIGGNATCSHFSTPLLPTLNWDYLQDFEYLQHWFTTTICYSHEDKRSLELRQTAPCNSLSFYRQK